jgi:acyl carrier protein
MNIENRVIRILEKRFPDVRPIKAGIGMNFYDHLGADSLGMMELVMDFEDEFNINISDKAYEKVQTVGDIIRVIEEICDQANDTLE